MDKLLDETASREISAQIKSKSKKPFDNAYKAALVTEGGVYAQGFLILKRKSSSQSQKKIIQKTTHYQFTVIHLMNTTER